MGEDEIVPTVMGYQAISGGQVYPGLPFQFRDLFTDG
jgi:hypothetical protein